MIWLILAAIAGLILGAIGMFLLVAKLVGLPPW